jgi:hypothetical protein
MEAVKAIQVPPDFEIYTHFLNCIKMLILLQVYVNKPLRFLRKVEKRSVFMGR